MSKKVLCMMCASLLLGACSYFDAGEPVEVYNSGPPAQKIDLMADGGSQNDSVEVYGLDGTRYVSKSRGFPAMKSGSSSVEVYPLDEEMAWMTAPRNRVNTGSSAAVAPVETVPSTMLSKDSGVNAYEQPYLAEQYVSPPAGAESPPQSIAQAPATSPPPQPQAAPRSAPRAGGVDVVYFDHASATLGGDDLSVIDSVAKRFKSSPGIVLSVEGHASSDAPFTDPVKRKMVNLKMSMDRAYAVVRALVGRGIPAESIRTVAWGEVRPAPGDGGSGGESAERRVEIIAQ